MSKNLFGTDGIRGTVGTAPLTPSAIGNLCKAIADWANEKTDSGYAEPSFLLAHDTRQSCDWIKEAFKQICANYHYECFDAGVLPTPAVLQRIRNRAAELGIIISASHNPYQDNGIKIVNKEGKIAAEDELRISALYHQYSTEHQTSYSDAILEHFPANFLAGKKVVLDCANGATYHVAPKIFERAGAQVIAINVSPNGTNINEGCGALHLEPLQQAVMAHHADIGFAFDGDGDRVIAVNRHGEIKDGDDLITLLLAHPAYEKTTAVVGTIMSNRGFELMLEQKGKKLLRAQVGDKYVAEMLQTNRLLIGGEPSGHIILRDYLPTGDGTFCALRVAHAAQLTGNWDLKTFTKFPQVMVNVRVKERRDLKADPLASLIAQAEKDLGPGRLIVRYSGTEPLLRIMAEAPELDLAAQSVSRLSDQIGKIL